MPEKRYNMDMLSFLAAAADALGPGDKGYIDYKNKPGYNWKTINNAKVLLNGKGKVVSGAGGVFKGKTWGTKWKLKKKPKNPVDPLQQAAQVIAPPEQQTPPTEPPSVPEVTVTEHPVNEMLNKVKQLYNASESDSDEEAVTLFMIDQMQNQGKDLDGAMETIHQVFEQEGIELANKIYKDLTGKAYGSNEQPEEPHEKSFNEIYKELNDMWLNAPVDSKEETLYNSVMATMIQQHKDFEEAIAECMTDETIKNFGHLTDQDYLDLYKKITGKDYKAPAKEPETEAAELTNEEAKAKLQDIWDKNYNSHVFMPAEMLKSSIDKQGSLDKAMEYLLAHHCANEGDLTEENYKAVYKMVTGKDYQDGTDKKYKSEIIAELDNIFDNNSDPYIYHPAIDLLTALKEGKAETLEDAMEYCIQHYSASNYTTAATYNGIYKMIMGKDYQAIQPPLEQAAEITPGQQLSTEQIKAKLDEIYYAADENSAEANSSGYLESYMAETKCSLEEAMKACMADASYNFENGVHIKDYLDVYKKVTGKEYEDNMPKEDPNEPETKPQQSIVEENNYNDPNKIDSADIWTMFYDSPTHSTLEHVTKEIAKQMDTFGMKLPKAIEEAKAKYGNEPGFDEAMSKIYSELNLKPPQTEQTVEPQQPAEPEKPAKPKKATKKEKIEAGKNKAEQMAGQMNSINAKIAGQKFLEAMQQNPKASALQMLNAAKDLIANMPPPGQGGTSWKADLIKAQKYLADIQAAIKNAKPAGLAAATAALTKFNPKSYTPEAKAKAIKCMSKDESKQKFQAVQDVAWSKCTHDEQAACMDYTSSYSKYNEPLRGIEYGTSKYKGVGNIDFNTIGEHYGAHAKGSVKKKIQDLTNAIDKSSYDQDIYLRRGVNYGGMDKFFKLPKSIDSYSVDELKSLLENNTYTEHGFMSCGAAEGTGFTGKAMELKIYAPAGTKMMYCPSFSHYEHENEMLLQRGTDFKVTHVTKENGKLQIHMEVVGYNMQQV